MLVLRTTWMGGSFSCVDGRMVEPSRMANYSTRKNRVDRVEEGGGVPGGGVVCSGSLLRVDRVEEGGGVPGEGGSMLRQPTPILLGWGRVDRVEEGCVLHWSIKASSLAKQRRVETE